MPRLDNSNGDVLGVYSHQFDCDDLVDLDDIPPIDLCDSCAFQ